jgi:NAD(P)-dependent dehydrogenase (short-subunit alcohol dehydrogenase family)
VNIPEPRTPDLFDINSRVVVVTGSTGVLGSHYCRVLAGRGALLVAADLSDRDPVKQAADLSRDLHASAVGVACDIRREADVEGLFDAAVQHFGRIDVVVNNAAATGEHLMRSGDTFAKFEDYPLSVWDEVLRTNLTGVFLVAREGGKRMLANGGGSMINIGSIYGVVAPDHRIYKDMPFSSLPAYSASKAGVHGLTLWLSTYWASSGIRVNTVCPGGVFNNHDPEFTRRYSERTPMGRMATPDDLAGIIVYLASDASRYCTGQRFVVDGGLTAW